MIGRKISVDNKEPIILNLSFKVYKFTTREKPERNVCIFPIFSEFGCEILGVLYCLPKLLRTKYLGKYVIVVGWYGREYLYKHLADEFWGLGEEHQWLREYARAFHHESINLKHIQKELGKVGTVVSIDELSNITVFPKLGECVIEGCGGQVINQNCTKCKAIYPEEGLFSRIREVKSEASWLPGPSTEAYKKAEKYLLPNAIGITARLRKTYGRNLQPIFYERLIYLLEDMGYRPIWLGETASILPCPFERLTDFSKSEDAKDLEVTLALVSRLKFTIQFWTASTRLAGLVGTPYIIFESPDQLYGIGQEGMRINLCTKGNRKIVISHFRNVYEDNTSGLDLAKRAIRDIEDEEYRDIIGLVENEEIVKYMRYTNLERIGNE